MMFHGKAHSFDASSFAIQFHPARSLRQPTPHFLQRARARSRLLRDISQDVPIGLDFHQQLASKLQRSSLPA